MYRRGDPRWNRTIQHISENLEHANEAAAENIYGFTQRYVSPCLAAATRCCNAVTAPCFPSSTDRRRTRNRARSRGRPELSFDFYDDWDDDEHDGLLGWGGASSYGTTYGTTQPAHQPPMHYASTNRARDPRFDPARRKSAALAHTAQDPTLIPSSSYFGFLPRLPFNLGTTKALRYKPSAADLADRPRHAAEQQPLLEDSEEDAGDYKKHRRARSNTHTSGHTTSSLSSRGDIFPSEDELDDAVALDDEFTIALDRRTPSHDVSRRNSQSQSGSNSGSGSASNMPSRAASSRTLSGGLDVVSEDVMTTEPFTSTTADYADEAVRVVENTQRAPDIEDTHHSELAQDAERVGDTAPFIPARLPFFSTGTG